MIIEHDKTGYITHIVFDPVPDGLAQVMKDNGALFLDLPPTPLPDIPSLDQNGDPMIDTTYETVLDEEGQPLISEDGSPYVEVIETPIMQTGRMEYASVDLQTDYVLDGKILKRPVFNKVPASVELVWGSSDMTIDDLPIPCTVTVDGEKHTIDDGTLTITPHVVADYSLTFEAFPYIPATMEVKVRASAA